MSIYDYINSHDIRTHWEKIGFVPNALEAAWLVWQSNDHTLGKRHSMYWTIIDNTEDCPIPSGLHDLPQESLHEFLYQYDRLVLHLISEFDKNEPNTVYSYRIYSDDAYSSNPLFSTFDEAYEHALGEIVRPHDPNVIEFVKTYISKEDKRLFALYTLDKKIVRIDERNFLDDAESVIFRGIWENMWFAFPTPFEKGDILKQSSGKYKIIHHEQPFVMTSVCTEHTDRLSGHGDGSDMTAHGYFAGKDGQIYYECVHNYMNLERATPEMAKRERMLIPISRYLKGEIDLALLLGAHKIMCYDVMSFETKRALNYTEEGFKLAGIIDEKDA